MTLADQARSYFDSACAFLQRGKIQEAVGQLSLAIGCDMRPEYYFHRAHLYLQLADIGNAQADLNTAEQLIDQVEDADLTRGDILHLRAAIESRAQNPLPNRQQIEKLAVDRQLAPLLAEMGFASFAPQLTSLVRPSMRLKPTGGTAPTGGSKLGGFPDVPSKFEWPVNSAAVPMAFVCQLNLSAVTINPQVSGLPPIGMLYFFYDAAALQRGPNGEFRVLYTPAAEHLHNMHSPDGTPQENSFFEAAVMLVAEDSLPDFSAPPVRALLPPESKPTYDDLLHLWYGAKPWHRLLGCSQGIQNCLEADLPGGRLLLQVDADADCFMEWRDGGRLFYAIRDSNPLVLSSDNCRASVQSY